MSSPVVSDQDHQGASRLLNLPAPLTAAEVARAQDAGYFYVTHASHGFSVGKIVELSGTSFVTSLTVTPGALRAMVVVVDGTSGYVLSNRGVITLAGLTAGATYYAASNGSLTTTPSSIRVGIAFSTTQLYLDMENEAGGQVPIGTILDFAGHTPPPGYLWCDGLFYYGNGGLQPFAATIGGIYGTVQRHDTPRTVSFTNGSTDVVMSSAGIEVGDVVFGMWSRFSLSEPANVPADSMPLYVVHAALSMIRLSQTAGGAALTANATVSGVPFMEGFRVPDLRGRVTVGRDNMTSDAGRMTTAGSGINGDVLGSAGGAQTHTLSVAEMPSHQHTIPGGQGNVTRGTGSANTASLANGLSAAQGGGGAHKNTQPSLICDKIIRYI